MDKPGGAGRGRSDAAARWLDASRSTQAFRLDEAGVVTEANPGALERLRPCGDVVGRPLADVLAPESLDILSAQDGEERLVTFGRGDVRYTLACRLFDDGTERWILGEPAGTDADLETELRRTNNELAVLAREHARQAVELRAALEERERARWTLERIGEFLSICMSCGALKTDTDDWKSASAFLAENGVALSHGYCPPCAERALRELEEQLG